MSGKTRRCANRVAQALRLDAVALRLSKSALGACYWRIRARMGREKAVAAAAHKLPRCLARGGEYIDRRQDYFEEPLRQRVLRHLTQRPKVMGMQLVPCEKTA